MDNLQQAITAWATDYAQRYESLESGRQQGGPETWCGPDVIGDALERPEFAEALQRVLEEAFRKAVG